MIVRIAAERALRRVLDARSRASGLFVVGAFRSYWTRERGLRLPRWSR